MTTITVTEKECKRCKTNKSIEEFPLRYSLHKSGKRYGPYLDYMCRSCKRESHKEWRDANPTTSEQYRTKTLKNYGLTIDDYTAMLEKQGGGCAICGKGPGVGATHTNLAVDHNHSTGVVRGLLCDPCNRAIGCMDDDSNRLISAAIYLITVGD